eukprot:jgi/Tetstr1/439734/TSEL_028153.t1
MNLPAPGDAHWRVQHDAIADAFRDHCVYDLELSLPAFDVVTGSYDPRSFKSTLVEFKTMRYGVKYTAVPGATAVDRFERSMLGDIQRGLAARDAAWHNTEPGQKGPLRDILDMSEYTGMVFGTVGEGQYSMVVAARCLQSGLPVAVKLYVKAGLHEVQRRQIEREIATHSKLIHPNIIDLYAAFHDDDCYYLVLELAEQDLFEAIKSQTRLWSEQEVVNVVALPLLRALSVLHHGGNIHRDIKPENLLLTRDGVLKLADFGVVVNKFEERPVSRAGTVQYMAPEIVDNPLKNGPDDFKDQQELWYDEKVDIWSAAVVIYEVLYGVPPFGAPAKTTGKQAVAARIATAELRFLPHIRFLSDEATDFLTACIQRQPGGRSCAAHLLFHDWLRLSSEQLMPRGLRQRHRNMSVPNVRALLPDETPVPAKSAKHAEQTGSAAARKQAAGATNHVTVRKAVRVAVTSANLSARPGATLQRDGGDAPEDPSLQSGVSCRRVQVAPTQRFPLRGSQTAPYMPELIAGQTSQAPSLQARAPYELIPSISGPAPTTRAQPAIYEPGSSRGTGTGWTRHGSAGELAGLTNSMMHSSQERSGTELQKPGELRMYESRGRMFSSAREAVKLPDIVKAAPAHSPIDVVKSQASILRMSLYGALSGMFPSRKPRQQQSMS